MMALVKTLMVAADGQEGIVVRIYHDTARRTFIPVVLRRMHCRVRPAFVNTVADEEIEVVDPSFAVERFAGATVRRVTDEVLAALGARDAKAAPVAELVQTIEIGPFDCPGETPWYFSARIHKDLTRARRFFPVVFRREFYRIKTSSAKVATDQQVEIVDSSFEPEQFARTSAATVRVAIVRHIRDVFEPQRAPAERARMTKRNVRRVALPAPPSWPEPRLLELALTAEAGPFTVGREPRVMFVVRTHKDLERAKRFIPIVHRRVSCRIRPSFGGKAVRRQIEVIDSGFVPDDFMRASGESALKAAVAAIKRAHGRAGRNPLR